MVFVVSGTRHGRPDVGYWLSYWARRCAAPERLVVGCARGVDRQAIRWAQRHGIELERHVADWSRGRRAGHERNQRMVNAAGRGALLVALPDVDSRGTYDCVRRALRAGLSVHVAPPMWPSRSTLRPARQGALGHVAPARDDAAALILPGCL